MIQGLSTKYMAIRNTYMEQDIKFLNDEEKIRLEKTLYLLADIFEIMLQKGVMWEQEVCKDIQSKLSA